MKEFFKNIFEVICYIGIVIGGTILCFIAIIPVFVILLLLLCIPIIILVLSFMILSLPFSIIDAVKKCFDKFDIKEKKNDENIVKK